MFIVYLISKVFRKFKLHNLAILFLNIILFSAIIYYLITLYISPHTFYDKGDRQLFYSAKLINIHKSYSFSTKESLSSSNNITIIENSPVSTSKSVRSRIPFRIHHLSKNDVLPSPYGMSLLAFLRLHRISNPRDGRAYERNYTTNGEEPEFDYTLWTDDSINAYIDALRGSASNIKESILKYTSYLLPLLNFIKSIFSKNTSNLKIVKNTDLNAEHQLAFYKLLDLHLSTSEMTDVIRLYVLYEFGGVYMDMDMMVVNSITSFMQKGYPCVISEEHPIQVRTF